jgi:hypothetical protein
LEQTLASVCWVFFCIAQGFVCDGEREILVLAAVLLNLLGPD